MRRLSTLAIILAMGLSVPAAHAAGPVPREVTPATPVEPPPGEGAHVRATEPHAQSRTHAPFRVAAMTMVVTMILLWAFISAARRDE